MKYIYTISDPTNNEVFYVGSTTNIEYRSKEHMSVGSNCYSRILSIKNAGHQPCFKEIDSISCNEDHLKLEQKWINHFLEKGNTLINIVGNSNAVKVSKKSYIKERQSKYRFSTLEIGGKFLCKRTDYNSMLTSLRQYNKRNETEIEVSAEDTAKPTLLSIKRTK